MTKSEFRVVSDETHGFRRLDPVPSSAAIDDFYCNQYYELIEEGKRGPDIRRLIAGGAVASKQLDWQKKTLYTDVVDSISQFSSGDKVLEVGCGTGDLLAYVNENGCKGTGVEIAKAAADIANERGLDVFHGAFESYAEREEVAGTVDVLLLMNVLEQTRDPAQFMAHCARVLAPGGVIIIRSGNEFNPLQLAACESLGKSEWWVSVPDQINYFNFDSMSKLLMSARFQIVEKRSDFPMEMFLLMGMDYTDRPAVGEDCHEKRVRFEMSLPVETRRAIYRSFADSGIGRCVYFVAKKK